MQPTREQFLASSARWRQAVDGITDRFAGTVAEEVARRAVAGEVPFRHIGIKFARVGRKDIDWSGPQYRHQEWPAQLNRFFQLRPLAWAYQQTREGQYADAAADYIRDWMRAHPAVADWRIAPYDNTLNLSIRVQSWLHNLPELLGSPRFDDTMLTAVFESVAAQLNYLSKNLRVFGNWRIAQADALLLAGVVLDGAPYAAAWRELAVAVLNDALNRQVLADGAHIERTPGYHEWMCRVFERYWRLGKAMPELGLAIPAEAVARMYDYSLGAQRPSGQCNAMHDSAGDLTGQRPPQWGQDRRRFLRDAGLSDGLPPTSQVFPDAGQALLRDSWDENATYVTFDATRWGGGHCHLSRNAIQIHAFGRTLLADVGTLTYEVSDPMMAHCKSTRAHNTVNLNGWNQSTSDPTTRFETADGYDMVASLYDGGYWPGRYEWRWPQGYGRGIWAQHYRLMLWVHGRFIVVLDDVRHVQQAGEEPTLQMNWQFGPGRLEVDSARRRATTTFGDANLLLMTLLAPAGMEMAVLEGQDHPPAGWMRGADGYVPAPQLRLSAARHAAPQADLVTVLVPFAGRAVPQVAAEAQATGDGRPGRLVLRWADGQTDTVVWTRRLESAIDQYEGIATDASLLHLARCGDGKLIRGIAIDATRLVPLRSERSPRPGTIVIG
ncbi:MAG: heparinase II/III family protein [Phycisphaerae bacterium]